jgi:hypothetical protein
MLPRIKNPYWRAAFWAAVFVALTSSFFYVQQFTNSLPGSKVLARMSSFCEIVLRPGIRLTLIVASLAEQIRNGHIDNVVGSFPFTVFGVVLINWLIYFGLLLLIFRAHDRGRSRKQTGEIPRPT